MIKIDTTSYKVEDGCYNKVQSGKNKICLMSTTLPLMSHIDRLSISDSYTLNNCPMFTITKDGTVYQHYDIDYFSDITQDRELNMDTISIAFENLGWLTFNQQKNIFLNWANFQADKDNIIDSMYKDYRYYDKITQKQQDSVLELCIYLCDTYNIKKDMVSHLFGYDEGNINKYQGVYCINNVLDKNTDINMSFNFKIFYKSLTNKL